MKKKRAFSTDPGQMQLPFVAEAVAGYQQLQIENAALKDKVSQLEAEISCLRSAQPSSSVEDSSPKSARQLVVPDEALPKAISKEADAKVKLFRQLFRGREDVYAERWQKKDGTSNYSPSRHHKWESHTKTERGKWQCGAGCQLVPLTDKVIEEHLKGLRTIGVYPMMKDETCWFLALDFDQADWSADAIAFLETCDRFEIPAYFERSRSGTGAHVWIFFDAPVRAARARALGSFLISETKQNRYQIAFKSYDRMFPNQDTMPKGGYGNLIALPLQREPRAAGNSVFIDRNLLPIEDQWAYLSQTIRMRSGELERLLQDAAAKDAIITVPLSSDDEDSDDPWKARLPSLERDSLLKEPFPKSLSIVHGNMVFVAKDGFGSPALSKIVNLATFQNPEFYQKQKTRQSTHDTPRVVCCAEDLPKFLALPRGCLDALRELMSANGIAITETDERNTGKAIDVEFAGTLRGDQSAASDRLLEHDIGTLCASTGFGKTVVAAKVIAERKTNTLILVHTLPLLNQWKDRLGQFLALPPKSIGQLGGGKKKSTGFIDVATIQSLFRKGQALPLVREYGQIIVDECHHISAFSFEQVIKQAAAKYVLGLTATLVRRDGHQPIVMMQCGPVRHKDDGKARRLATGVKHVVVQRDTGFVPPVSAEREISIQDLYAAISNDSKRNELIFDDILKELDQGRSPLVITERVNQLTELSDRLKGFAKNIIVLKGGMKRKESKAVFEQLKSVPGNAERIILATGKYIGEGFDDARLDTLFLLSPVSFRGRVEQYAGRLHREYEGKTDVRIYDYVDGNHPIFRKMFERRCAKYRNLGYEILKPDAQSSH
jgi:superfamily II DNA or RNA helicase